MNESKNVPKIRFEGFSGEWENKKLKELCNYFSSSLTENDIDYNGIYDLYDANTIIGKTNKCCVNERYITIIKDGAGVGRIRMLPKNTMFLGTMGGLTTKKNNLDFLYYLIKNKNFGSKYTGSTIPHIYFRDYGKTKCLIPFIKEQTLIGQYFSNIDNLIKLQQQKYEKLLNLKKSLLYKLFPKEGETVPELRFEGFSGKWEKKKLGNCFSERTESYPEGELLSVTINQGIKKFSELDRKNNSNDNKSKYKKVYVGDIAYNSMRMWQGASGYSEYEGIVSPAYTVLSPNDVIDSKCFSYLFKRTDIIHMFQIYSKGITSDNWNLKYPDFKELEVYVSQNYNEQKAIGQYFSKLDKLIELNKEKLEKLKNVKESLLDKMFV